MIFEQHYLDCLSQVSYFIGDETTKRAVVVDPGRDIAPNIGLAGRYVEFAGGVIQPGVAIALVVEEGQELESRIRLARIGFDNVVGYRENHLAAFNDHLDDVKRSSRVDLAGMQDALAAVDDLQVVDVRQPGETVRNHRRGQAHTAQQPESEAGIARCLEADHRVMCRRLSFVHRCQSSERRRFRRCLGLTRRIRGVGGCRGTDGRPGHRDQRGRRLGALAAGH